MTSYPFRLDEALLDRLPASGVDGFRNIDVRVRGTWEGILVVDSEGRCVGIRVRRRVEEYPLPFEPLDIEDVRPACRWSLILAAVPFDLYNASVFTAFIGSPALLILSRFVLQPLSIVATAACLVSIYFMYQSPGFPFIRPLAAMIALAQAFLGAAWFLVWVGS